MICPKCKTEQTNDRKECVRCGVIFAKLEIADDEGSGKSVAKENRKRDVVAHGGTGLADVMKDYLLGVKPGENLFIVAARAMVFLVFLLWGIKFIRTPLDSSDLLNTFMHAINLPFHEAGHIFFSLFGHFLGVLGGTLGQMIIPLICTFAFLYYRNPFAASITLWWLAQSFMDIAPYINDAQKMTMPLLGGITGNENPDVHDWHVILGSFGRLHRAHALARLTYFIGTLIMLTSFLWGGYILYRQYQSSRQDPGSRPI